MSLELVAKGYALIGFLVFSAIFLFSSSNIGKPFAGRVFGYLDLFFISLSMGATWPYALLILFMRGSRGED